MSKHTFKPGDLITSIRFTREIPLIDRYDRDARTLKETPYSRYICVTPQFRNAKPTRVNPGAMRIATQEEIAQAVHARLQGKTDRVLKGQKAVIPTFSTASLSPWEKA